MSRINPNLVERFAVRRQTLQIKRALNHKCTRVSTCTFPVCSILTTHKDTPVKKLARFLDQLPQISSLNRTISKQNPNHSTSAQSRVSSSTIILYSRLVAAINRGILLYTPSPLFVSNGVALLDHRDRVVGLAGEESVHAASTLNSCRWLRRRIFVVPATPLALLDASTGIIS